MRVYNGERLEIAYHQISVFWAGIESPFSDWDQRHVDQGFTWRKDAVGIMTISDSGLINTGINKNNKIYDDAKRVLILPFSVQGGKGVEVSTIISGYDVAIADGIYNLLIQLGVDEDGVDWCWFSFLDPDITGGTPRYIKVDDQIKNKTDFIMEARPA